MFSTHNNHQGCLVITQIPGNPTPPSVPLPSALNLRFNRCPQTPPGGPAAVREMLPHGAPLSAVPFACLKHWRVALPWTLLLSYKGEMLPAPSACHPPHRRHAWLLRCVPSVQLRGTWQGREGGWCPLGPVRPGSLARNLQDGRSRSAGRRFAGVERSFLTSPVVT